MDLLQDIYHTHPGFCNAAIALLIFGGMGRIAFWRDQDGLRVGGMLATGLALLLSVALLIWADEHHRCIQEFGPWAVFLLIETIIILALNARRKAKRL
jgi:hypothetical protein